MTRVAPLFSPDVFTAEVDPRDGDFALFPEEEALVARAVEKRRREFAAARALFRRGLSHLGLPPSALLNGEDRAPLWPEGVVGTISHTDGYCAVAMTSARAGIALGLDVEKDEPLRPELWKMVCTEAERASLAALPPERAGRVGKLVFSAKECAYKAQYHVSRTFLGFHAMRIEVDEAAESFVAVFEKPAGDAFQPGDRIEGRFRHAGGLVLTGAVLPIPR